MPHYRQLIVALVLLLCGADAARACGDCSDGRSWPEVKAEADVLFVGRFVGEADHRSFPGLKWLRLPTWLGFGEEEWTYEFVVEEGWTRPLPPRVSVVAEGSCMYGVPKTQPRMLIEAVEWEGEWYSSLCNRSVPIWTPSQIDSLQREEPDWYHHGPPVTQDTLQNRLGAASPPSRLAGLSPSVPSGRRSLASVAGVGFVGLIVALTIRRKRRAA